MFLAAFMLLLQADQVPTNPVHPDLADLKERWRGAMLELGVPALAMVLVEGDEVVHQVTLGERDIEKHLPVTPDTLFYIASTTKTFVATALVQLAERGRVELDAPVKRYLPRFELADPAATESITVRDLLCHRFGLNSGPIVLLDAYTGEISEERYYHFLKRVEPAGFGYSNLHFTLAGRVIEAVTGKSWRDYLAEELFAPAGMKRSSGYASWMYAQEDVAHPTVFAGGGIRAAPVRKSDRTMHAAGGLGTSIHDLAQWLRLQLNQGVVGETRLVSAASLTEMYRLQSKGGDSDEFGPLEGFGLGWQRGSYRGHLELRHGGGYVGAASYVCFLPELGLGLAALASGDFGAQVLLRLVSSDVHERLLADDEVADTLGALLTRVRSERKRDAEREAEMSAQAARAPELSLPAESYFGTYRHEFFGTFTLEQRAGRLVAALGDLGLSVMPVARDVVRLWSAGSPEATATFEVTAGRVPAVSLDLDGPVRFARGAP